MASFFWRVISLPSLQTYHHVCVCVCVCVLCVCVCVGGGGGGGGGCNMSVSPVLGTTVGVGAAVGRNWTVSIR